jgi:hypothetical protein
MRTPVRIVSEVEFDQRIRQILNDTDLSHVRCVTGPGRSGAIASVYASHILRIPFIPYGATCPPGWNVLVIDTARESGRTLRKAERRYDYANPTVLVCFEEPPRVAFWYEAPKPQRYRHEPALIAA